MVTLLLLIIMLTLQNSKKRFVFAVVVVIMVLMGWQLVPEEYKLRYFTIFDDISSMLQNRLKDASKALKMDFNYFLRDL